MKKMFLSSSFNDVYQFLENFYGESVKGKTVAFIDTASLVEDYTKYVDDDRKAFIDLGIIIKDLDIIGKHQNEISKVFSESDMIFVSGGNTFYLLQELKKSNADQLIIDEIKKGKIYIGSSAGSIILSKDILYVDKMDDKRKATELENFLGLNMVDFYTLPHLNNEPFTEIVEDILKENNRIDKLPLVPISNHQVILVNNSQYKIIG
ncbi:Type 1 glutamine amidotransferase-like domain-containing protein [Chishuiella sp.]|uniref:Type 1 glutamine amidotransferase-like domain-containing protein n=1 Tax=Chishuiella sp. TaxID=1969467 RepID=UPI0028AACDFC|nr:Type 1 glutamine amidotransferase-like domain-containing protein [Chishuiella sp.]